MRFSFTKATLTAVRDSCQDFVVLGFFPQLPLLKSILQKASLKTVQQWAAAQRKEEISIYPAIRKLYTAAHITTLTCGAFQERSGCPDRTDRLWLRVVSLGSGTRLRRCLGRQRGDAGPRCGCCSRALPEAPRPAEKCLCASLRAKIPQILLIITLGIVPLPPLVADETVADISQRRQRHL